MTDHIYLCNVITLFPRKIIVSMYSHRWQMCSILRRTKEKHLTRTK